MAYDCIVVGGGLAGSIAALALAKKDLSVAFIAPVPEKPDGRTTALMDQSLTFLSEIGVWDKIKPHAAPLQTMRIIEGTKRLLRGPTVSFSSQEIGLDAFGYNIPNAPMLKVLTEETSDQPFITRFTTKVTNYHSAADGLAEVTLETGETIVAKAVVAADGRNSVLRDAAGIDVRRWSYPQTAMVMNFAHSRPHGQISNEFHTESGPFTQVPLPGNNSSLVWVNRPEDADKLMQLSLSELARRVEDRMQSILGTVTISQPPQAWPLSGMTANRFGKGPLVLVGEAGHVFPPIGAQGLNLSLRDIMTFLDIVATSENWSVIGDRFDTRRRADVLSRTASVDLLNRSLLSSFLPVQMVRAAGLHVLSSISPLKQLVMREGIEPGAALKAFPAMLREQIRRKRA